MSLVDYGENGRITPKHFKITFYALGYNAA
jgi:hypothetical protein